MKIKIGEAWGRRTDRDIARMRQTRSRIGPDVKLYVDPNGAYTPKQAIRSMEEVGDAHVVWFEEPVSSEDLAGLRQVRDQVRADDTAGEYGYDLTYFARMCAANARGLCPDRRNPCRRVHRMAPDRRCRSRSPVAGLRALRAQFGLRALRAQFARSRGRPTLNLRHLEYVSDHVRIEQLIFDNTLDPDGGQLRPRSDLPGHGMTLLDERAEPLPGLLTPSTSTRQEQQS